MAPYRFLGMLTAIVMAVVWLTPASAQSAPFWVRGYPQQAASGCVEYVALWSDGSFTTVPWSCPAGVVPKRADSDATAVRSYPQPAANGCVEYVVNWSDGAITWVPFSCPAGVVYPKPGFDAPAAPAGPAPTGPAPAATPAPSNFQYRTNGVTFERQCGFTLLKIYVADAAGNPVNGVVARVEWDGMQGDPIITNPTGRPGSYAPGWTDASLSGRGMVIGSYRVWLLNAAGQRASDTVAFDTNNDCYTEAGKQIVTVNFQEQAPR